MIANAFNDRLSSTIANTESFGGAAAEEGSTHRRPVRIEALGQASAQNCRQQFVAGLGVGQVEARRFEAWVEQYLRSEPMDQTDRRG